MKITSNKNKKILLLDNKTGIKNIKNQNFDKIIVFDFEISRELRKLNIEHVLSESFISEDDFKKIQKKSYDFSQWFLDKEISNYLSYENVNLGSLFYIELYVFLIPILKKIREIQNIIKEFPNTIFISSKSLKNILLNLKTTFEEVDEGGDEEIFFYDKISIENKYLKFSIPRKYYFQIKNLNDKFTTSFISNKNQAKMDVMLIEFDIIRHQSLISQFVKKNISTGYFGIRRPPIWNLKSLSIVKNNKIFFANHFKFKKNIFEKEYNKVKRTLEQIFQNSEFDKKFLFFDKDIENIVKPIIKKLLFRRLSEFLKNIDFVKQNLLKFHPKSVMILSESGTTEQIVIQLSKKMGISVILLQHGMFNDTPESHEYNKFTGSVLRNSDKFFVWGNALERYSKQYNLETKNIFKLGSSIHDEFFDLVPKKNNYVLVIAQGPAVKLHVKDYTEKAQIEYEEIIERICKICKIKKKKVIIKLHPHEKGNNEEIICKESYYDAKVIKKGDATELIKNAGVIISVGTTISTAILESHILKKPVIRIPYGEWYGKPDYLRKQTCTNVNLDNLEETLSKLEQDNEFYTKVIKIGEIFLQDYLEFPGEGSKNISQFISENI